MADRREGQEGSTKQAVSKDKAEAAGRRRNEARPSSAAPDKGGPERYPPVRSDDAVEARSFEPPTGAPAPTNSGKVGPDGKPAEDARQPGFEGPKGDPAEGRR